MLNVALRKKLLPSNPCWGVEFLVAVKGFIDPALSWHVLLRRELDRARPHDRARASRTD